MNDMERGILTVLAGDDEGRKARAVGMCQGDRPFKALFNLGFLDAGMNATENGRRELRRMKREEGGK